ncbi:MAG: acyl-CoA dehydratase activase-related protein, partial [Angelakisella sp.]
FIGGNRCDRPITGSTPREQLNMFEYKRSLLSAYQPQPGSRGRLGLPMVLNLYELLPFWHTFFTALGFEVVTSPPSNRALYLSGQHTIPSDTVCFPAKLAHGHIEALLDMGVDAIFYPCMTYNLNEKMGDNHYNCPVVAYYPEVIRSNVDNVSSIPFLCDYVGLHRPKDFTKKMTQVLGQYFTGISRQEVALAAEKAYAAYDRHMADIQAKGLVMLTAAREQKMPIIVLAGRPYHIDPEINHGIDKLICDFGAAVLTEDSVPFVRQRLPVTVLNQWTYHARLYASANYVKDQLDMNLVQLVSFGCGVDAITTDEVRSIIESAGRIYTQLKIDEITNLGAVKIRLRSLFATMPRKELEQ